MPSRRTRDPDEVDISWEIDAYQFELPRHRRGDGRRDQPGHRDRDGPPRRCGCAAPRGPVDAATRTPSRSSRRSPTLDDEQALGAAAGALRRARRARADRASASSRSATAARPSCVAVTPSSTESLLPHIIEAEPDLLVIQGTVISAEHVSEGHTEPLNLKHLVRRLEIPVHRRRLRQLPGRAAPDAHRCRRRARRRRSGRHLDDQPGARRGQPAGHGHRRCPRRTHAPPRRDRRLRARHRRRRHGHRRRHRQGRRVRRRRRHARLAARRAPPRRRPAARPGAMASFHRTLPRGRLRRFVARWDRSSRSWSGPLDEPTAAPT